MALLDKLTTKAILQGLDKNGVKYQKTSFQINDRLVGLKNKAWEEYIREGLIVEVRSAVFGELELIGENGDGVKTQIGHAIIDEKETYPIGIVLPVLTMKDNSIKPDQFVLLLEAEEIPEEMINTTRYGLRKRAGDNKTEKFVSGLESAGNSLMPISIIVIFIFLLIYMCS